MDVSNVDIGNSHCYLCRNKLCCGSAPEGGLFTYIWLVAMCNLGNTISVKENSELLKLLSMLSWKINKPWIRRIMKNVDCKVIIGETSKWMKTEWRTNIRDICYRMICLHGDDYYWHIVVRIECIKSLHVAVETRFVDKSLSWRIIQWYLMLQLY